MNIYLLLYNFFAPQDTNNFVAKKVIYDGYKVCFFVFFFKNFFK